MGRCNDLPEDTKAPCKLRLIRLRWYDGDYDQGGAYWGNSRDGSAIYWAFSLGVMVWVRAKSRSEAKAMVREDLPNAKFCGGGK